MKCSRCNDNKLSKEFPSKTVTERCTHIASHCLSCLVEELGLTNTTNNQRKCPECTEILSDEEVEILLLSWNKASFKIDVENIGKVKLPQNADGNGTIYIVLLNGHKFPLEMNKIPSITELKKEVRRISKVDTHKQKLIYNRIELQDYNNGTPNTLQSYNIGPGSRIQLIVVLYNITSAESIKDLVFDLHWNYPATGKDYLDGSCMVYAGTIYDRKFDYISQQYGKSFPHMSHTGDLMDDTNKIGHHTIKANLEKLPDKITHLYFVLSSYRSPNIGHYPNPTFKLVDETQPDKALCSYQLGQAAESQAVIMCCISRGIQGWEVVQIGKLSDGNVDDYEPIKKSITECFLFG